MPAKTLTAGDGADVPSTEGRHATHIHGHAKASVVGLGLAALGVVFGDIGTSPLYTMKTVLDLAGGGASRTPRRFSEA